MTRPNWDETWMAVATAMSKRSRCVNRQVGAVIVTKENRPMAVGYNGPPAKFDKTEVIIHFASVDVVSDHANRGCEAFCPRGGSNDRGTAYSNCVSVHAEANALLFADRRDYEGGTIYVTNPCCWECSKLVANSGVSRVVFRVSEADKHADIDKPLSFLRECGILVDIINDKETA